jgi:hypothetical protein
MTGILAFSSSNYSVAESGGKITIGVMRTGGSSGTATVAYATQAGTAEDAVNYGNTTGVLTWADGDAMPKSFSIPIFDSSSFTGTRSLTVRLAGVTGASLGSPASATIAISGDGVTTPPTTTVAKKSISGWVSCSGTSDDTAGIKEAFAAARNGAFTLVVDCPVKMVVGMDITRPVFIDNGTTVEFSGSGQITVDNVFIPAFVIANSSNITLTNWNVLYNASLPVDPAVDGYVLNGQFISNSNTQPGNAFNDVEVTNWLAANRNIVFDSSRGTVKSSWAGSTNECAVFLISGDSANVSVTGMQLAVPAGAGGNRFIPVAFSMNLNFKSNQTVNSATPMTSQYFAVPHLLTFSGITLDGTYMGWVGGATNSVFQNIQSNRYGDLQDANGENVGGLNKWFAPPHLFYLSWYSVPDTALLNSNIKISNVVDNGIRVGLARDKGGSDSISGYALSLKISCITCSVDTYTSKRPDGFMDVLVSSGLTVSNVSATYDSSFLNNVYPGWRFPSEPYKNLTFTNISLSDTAASSVQPPIGNAGMASNDTLVFSNVKVGLQKWSSTTLPLPTIAGAQNDVSLNYFIENGASRIVRSQTDTVIATLEATPSSAKAGETTLLSWSSHDAQTCSATGAWSGSLPTAGTRQVTLTASGSYGFSIVCANSSNASNTATAAVLVN